MKEMMMTGSPHTAVFPQLQRLFCKPIFLKIKHNSQPGAVCFGNTPAIFA